MPKMPQNPTNGTVLEANALNIFPATHITLIIQHLTSSTQARTLSNVVQSDIRLEPMQYFVKFYPRTELTYAGASYAANYMFVEIQFFKPLAK